MKQPRLIRFLFGHMLVGIAVGWIILGAIFWLDVASLRTLIGQTGAGWIAVPVMAILFAITFGSLAMGTGVMLLPKDDDDDDDAAAGPGPRRAPHRPAVSVAPVPARARAPRR
jgi:hypothetical protein